MNVTVAVVPLGLVKVRRCWLVEVVGEDVKSYL